MSLRKIGGDICYDRVEHFSKAYLRHKQRQDDVYTLLKEQNLAVNFDDIDEIIATHVQHRNTVIAECQKLFGPKFTIDYISGKVDEMTRKYGGQEPQVDHMYFTKSEDDPWRWAGIIDECATIIPGIGHCHDLRAPKDNDSPELIAARQKGFDLIAEWINGNGTSRETITKC
ncbi:hypothetical protein ACLKA6_005197 [Drosophila palustris]